MFLLYVLFVPLFGAYGALLYANPGHNVTLPCYFASGGKYLCWYKQVGGKQPQIISSFYKHSPDSNSFYKQFKDNKRFSVHIEAGFYNLNISNVRDSDSAMYYCGQVSALATEFDNGTFLVLKESSRRSFLQQPESDSVKPGGSVTLYCTVHIGTRDAEHTVYWFKTENSTNSSLGTMYIHTDGSSQCVQSLESDFPAQSCVHSLSKWNVSLSDAGTYYCAVALCGEILFGKGTRLEVGDKQHDIFPLLMQCGVAALLLSVISNIVLIGIICKVSRRKHLNSGGLHPHSSVPEFTVNSQNMESDALQYETLDFKKIQCRRQKSTEEETVYSKVRRSDLK